MLDELEKIIASLEAFDGKKEFITVIRENADKVTDLMREQLSEGIDNTGQQRDDSYNPVTVIYKKLYGSGIGSITDRVTFYMTGDNYQKLQTVINEDEYEINSKGSISEIGVDKFERMIERIGLDRFGLDETNRKSFAENVALPAFSEILQEQTGLIISK